MNLRFLAQSEYFNGIHLKDDIILEKEYESSPFKELKKAHYFLYRLESNIREEILPEMDKIDVFKIYDCVYRSDNVYFTEYVKQSDGSYVFNIIRYDYSDNTWSKLVTLKDDMRFYPDNKQIKIFILNDSNLILQRAVKRINLQDNYEGFFDFSSLLYDFVSNVQTPISDENLAINGIDYIMPFSENICIMKTGFSLYKDNRHELLSKDEATVESIIMVNVQQFISDLLLKQTNMVMTTLDQCFYDVTISNAITVDNYLIYSKYDFINDYEIVTFLNMTTRKSIECINKNSNEDGLLAKNYIINGVPHVRLDKDKKTEFFNLETKEVTASFPKKMNIVFMNNNVLVSTFKEKSMLGGYKDYVCIHKFPSPNVILQEKGKYLGAVASDDDTTFIFLK